MNRLISSTVRGAAVATVAGAMSLAAAPAVYAHVSDPPSVQVFEYSGRAVSWTVPDGVQVVRVEIAGGSGGSAGADAQGGSGATIVGNLQVSPGQVLQLGVGGRGGDRTGSRSPADVGWGMDGRSGGLGGTSEDAEGYGGAAGGGGASVIRRSGVPLIIAGGGGGGACDAVGLRGGDAGMERGQDGIGSDNSIGSSFLGGRGAVPDGDIWQKSGTNAHGRYYAGGGGGGWHAGGGGPSVRGSNLFWGSHVGAGGGGNSFVDRSAFIDSSWSVRTVPGHGYIRLIPWQKPRSPLG